MMQTTELERAAYIADDPTAALLARIADLEAMNESLQTDVFYLRDMLNDLEMER